MLFKHRMRIALCAILLPSYFHCNAQDREERPGERNRQGALPDRPDGPPGGPFGFGPPAGPFGMGPGGFGPPGMGGPMIPGLGPVNDSILSLLELEEVRKEIQWEKDQQEKQLPIERETRDEVSKIMDDIDFSSIFELEPEERQAKFASLRQAIEKINQKSDDSIKQLMTPQQRERIDQLSIQRRGSRAWQDRELHNRLDLKRSQRESIRAILDAARPNAPGPGGPGSGGPGPNFPPMGGPPFGPMGGPDDTETVDKLIALLDKDQLEKWNQLIGAKFAFPQLIRIGPGPMNQQRKLIAEFDRDSDGVLNKTERAEARKKIASQPNRMGPGGRRGPGGPEGRGFGPPGMEALEPATPGPKVALSDVESYPDEPLYSKDVVRTLFLTFDGDDWESELADFNNTDVDVPADLTVDGKTYPNVGVHFRGMSSFGMVPAGHKRSLNLSMDYFDEDQRLLGRKTLNLLNSHEDPTFLHSVLYLEAAQKYTLAPVANFVHVVINGESWGLYVNAEQFNKEFVEARFDSNKGARWKVPGSPGGRGGLEYTGDDIEPYKRVFQIRSKDNKESWEALVQLCKVLNTTPTEQLPQMIEPILDIEGTLKFLALDVALINGDGYWTRASDYGLYRDPKGQFHLVVHDANETLKPPMGPGMGGPGMGPRGRGRDGGPNSGPTPQRGPGENGTGDSRERFDPRPGQSSGNRGPRGGGANGGGPMARGVELDPLVGLNDPSKPLRSKLLAVPEYRKRYLEYVSQINEEILGGDYLRSRLNHYVPLIESYVEKDTRKLTSLESFHHATALRKSDRPASGRDMSLLDFAAARYEFLKNYRPGENP